MYAFIFYCAVALFSVQYVLADGDDGSSQVTSTQEPLISTQELQGLVERCSQETQSLHDRRRDVPQEKAKDFSVALGVASDDCLKLRKVMEWLRMGTKLRDHYTKYLEQARSATSGFGEAKDLAQLDARSMEGGHAYADDAVEAAPLPTE